MMNNVLPRDNDSYLTDGENNSVERTSRKYRRRLSIVVGVGLFLACCCSLQRCSGYVPSQDRHRRRETSMTGSKPSTTRRMALTTRIESEEATTTTTVFQSESLPTPETTNSGPLYRSHHVLRINGNNTNGHDPDDLRVNGHSYSPLTNNSQQQYHFTARVSDAPLTIIESKEVVEDDTENEAMVETEIPLLDLQDTSELELDPTADTESATKPKFRPFRKKGVESSDLRNMWSHRHARNIEEGIRREKATRLSNVLAAAEDKMKSSDREYAARTISGLISALAEEVNDLNVEVRTQRNTPLWRKEVEAVRIDFSRLAFKPLKLGGSTMETVSTGTSSSSSISDATSLDSDGTVVGNSTFDNLPSADEVFDRIDVDNSGALDSDEIAQALNLATVFSARNTTKNLNVIKKLASELVKLYDFNGDGVVDRDEYQSMVEDMAALRETQAVEDDVESELYLNEAEEGMMVAGRRMVGNMIARVVGVFGIGNRKTKEEAADDEEAALNPVVGFNTTNDEELGTFTPSSEDGTEIVDLSDYPDVDRIAKSVGSITLSDLKLDLRRLVFGAIPFVKRITPGGPLVLEPFTVTIDGSFSREDIMDSFLLDAGLRQLVARALRRRVGSLRDLLEGALFTGRSWKLNGESSPSVVVPKLTNIEFDDDNRLIITGRARVQSSKYAPAIENAFKVRTRVGIRKGGRVIRLVEPELALVLECPKVLEEKVWSACDALDLKRPPRPKPIYSFFPIYSPFKVDDNDGFDLGEDNKINAIYIRDGALRFELSAVLRPGRFLGSHYIAFTVPIRTFIVTLDRVREGMRAARRAKKAAKAERARTKIEQALDAELNRTDRQAKKGCNGAPKSFFNRFVEGYFQAERDVSEKARITQAIRDFFGRQRRRNNQKMRNYELTRDRDLADGQANE